MKFTWKEKQAINRDWRKVMKAASRTCWDTGQPFNGLGCFLAYRQHKLNRS